ncbi:MAG: SIS domain-containing protein [Clostridiales bacterium]|nr:SIS domain-containing protein [Bacillota bacterium]NLL53531.1 SIS domain-containing protein [Clostridiales bacterium]
MSRQMFAYIQEEASCTQELLTKRKSLAQPVIDRFLNRGVDRIFLFGAGSSRNAALIAQPFIEDILQVEATVCMPSRADTARRFSTEKSMLVLVSQGGYSTNTIDAAKQCGLDRRSIIAITENPSSPVAQEAGILIQLPWDSPEIVGAKTKGVTCSAVVLMLAALELALAKGKIQQARYESIIAAFETFVTNHSENVRRVVGWVADNADEMKNMPALLILAQGAYLGAGMECALKLLETIYRPVTAYEFEEYLHGVGNSIGANNNFLLALMPADSSAERMSRLVRFAEEKGSSCYTVLMNGDKPADQRQVSLISSGCDYVDSLNYLLPGQILSSDLSEVCGYNIDKNRFEDFASLMQTKA